MGGAQEAGVLFIQLDKIRNINYTFMAVYIADWLFIVHKAEMVLM